MFTVYSCTSDVYIDMNIHMPKIIYRYSSRFYSAPSIIIVNIIRSTTINQLPSIIAEECETPLPIHVGSSFYDVVKHVQKTEAVLKNGLACLNRNESLFRVAVIPAEPKHLKHFFLVVSLNHTIGSFCCDSGVFCWEYH